MNEHNLPSSKELVGRLRLIDSVVAIPAVVFFNMFQRIIKSRLQRADALGRELLAVLKATPRGLAAGAE